MATMCCGDYLMTEGEAIGARQTLDTAKTQKTNTKKCPPATGFRQTTPERFSSTANPILRLFFSPVLVLSRDRNVVGVAAHE